MAEKTREEQRKRFKTAVSLHSAVWTRALIRLHEKVRSERKINLTTPNIEFLDSVDLLGQWQPRKKTIAMSVHLILERDWQVVEAVFRHEMAHQMVTEVFRGDEIHGPLFKRACDALGVPPEFQTALCHEGGLLGLPEWDALTDSPDDAKILKRLKALERLRDRASNDHERENALMRIHEHLTKYSIEALSSDEERRYVTLRLRLGKQQVEPWQSTLAGLLREFCRVETVTTFEFDAVNHCYNRAIDLFGTSASVKHAHYVWGCLEREVEARWEAYKATEGAERKNHKAFKEALILGFREKLGISEKASKESQPAATTALIELARAEVKDYIRHFYPRLRQLSKNSTQRGAAFAAGKAAGAQVSLRDAVDSSQSKKRALLTG